MAGLSDRERARRNEVWFEQLHQTIGHRVLDVPADLHGLCVNTLAAGFDAGVMFALQYPRLAVLARELYSPKYPLSMIDEFAGGVREKLWRGEVLRGDAFVGALGRVAAKNSGVVEGAEAVTPTFDKDGKLVWERVESGLPFDGRHPMDWLPEWPGDGA